MQNPYKKFFKKESKHNKTTNGNMYHDFLDSFAKKKTLTFRENP